MPIETAEKPITTAALVAEDRELRKIIARSEELLRLGRAHLANMKLIGRRVRTRGGGGMGLYEITEARLTDNFTLRVRGHKVKDGGLGAQPWDIPGFSVTDLV